MVKFVQILSLKNMLSKLNTCKETLLRQTSFLASSLNKNQCLNQIHSQELQIQHNNEILQMLEQKHKSLKSESEAEYFQIMESTFKLLDQQLQLIKQIMKSKITEIKQNILHQDKSFQKKLPTTFTKFGNLILTIQPICKNTWKLLNLIKELSVINTQRDYANTHNTLKITKNWNKFIVKLKRMFFRNTKICAMTLFVHTQDEVYYEHFILNESICQDQSFEIRFHLFATQYFQRQNCHHTTKYHRQQCEFMSSEHQRSIAQSNLELQLSFMQNKSKYQL